MKTYHLSVVRTEAVVRLKGKNPVIPKINHIPEVIDKPLFCEKSSCWITFDESERRCQEAAQNRAFLRAVMSGDVSAAGALIKQGADPTTNESASLRLAVEHSTPEMVKFLIPQADPKAMKNLALVLAAERGDLDILALLIQVSDVASNNSEALRRAVLGGQKTVQKMLLDKSDLEPALAEIKIKLEDPRAMFNHTSLSDSTRSSAHDFVAETSARLSRESLHASLSSNLEARPPERPRRSL